MRNAFRKSRFALYALILLGANGCVDSDLESSGSEFHAGEEVAAGAQKLSGPATGTLPGYDAPLPHTTQAPVSNSERSLLKAYLSAPADQRLIRKLAKLHLDAADAQKSKTLTADSLSHLVIAQYFLNRLLDLGVRDESVAKSLQRAESVVSKALDVARPTNANEHRPAHVYYREAFHLNQEQNRYEAIRGLLGEVLADPSNVYTSFAITAANLWVGGEADYDDPTTLYNFVVGGYFSLRAMDLAKRLEANWEQDASNPPRWRMAANLGGFSVLQRRWLAVAHGDTAAVPLIDAEHKQWLDVQLAFHGFTYGLTFFDDTDSTRFEEGLKAYLDSFTFCQEVPVRTCSDLPRFTFNLLTFQLGYVDYLLKKQQVEAARAVLTFRFAEAVPTTYNGPSNEAALFELWTIGRDAWKYREQNAEAIAAMFLEHPDNAPTNFQLKKKAWGGSTITCQECHETQAKVWTPEEFNTVIYPPEEVASVGTWPEVTTSWYGATKR